uniref:SAC domain-containing protein n=1 Tax=Panagrolaimus davidi TaxID=227884 RepID=A0A914Q0C2_9BILA
MLHAQFLKTVKYLNQFMKPGKKIDYISFDVARCNKTGLVLQRLEQIGTKLILKQGWFQSFKTLRVRKIMKHSTLENFAPHFSEDGEMLLQSGISRTNCVDCLDRTNVSQFGLGKAALGFQLYSMGYLDEPHISTTSELCRVYEDMYDEHGDTMAWQYAGSHLVHSIKTYKKTSAFQERSRDVIQTISRYYSNTFNDYEKQNGINLFLGLFRPFAHIRPHLWDLFTDRYLHFPIKREPKINDHKEWVENVNSESEGEDDDDEWTDWFAEYPEDREIYGSELYRSLDCSDSVVSRTPLPNAEMMYWKFHKELEITNFEQVLKEISQQTNKKVISLSDLNQSIFQTMSFMKLWKTPETPPIVGGKKGPLGSFTNPEEDEDDDILETASAHDSEDELKYNEDFNPPFLSSRQGSNSPTQLQQRSTSPFSSSQIFGIDTGLKSSIEFYGFEIAEPSGQNLEKYERYANIAEKERQYLEMAKNGEELHRNSSSLQLEPLLEFSPSIFTVDSIYETEILGATENAINIYKEYVSLKDNFIVKNNIPDNWNSFVM